MTKGSLYMTPKQLDLIVENNTPLFIVIHFVIQDNLT